MRRFLLFLLLIHGLQAAEEPKALFWWRPAEGENFGDHLSRVIVERMVGENVVRGELSRRQKMLFSVGSILHFAREGDLVWGSGCRSQELQDQICAKSLDVRAVRGPLTRRELLQRGIACPEVYGDPVLLMPILFPEWRVQRVTKDYVIIPNIAEASSFALYKNVILPTEPWEKIVGEILSSKLVISSSLHGIVVAEAYGIPARLLKMTWLEPLYKYEDYYQGTGRPHFKYAMSVYQALKMGGERPIKLDLRPLYNSFPWDYFNLKQ